MKYILRFRKLLIQPDVFIENAYIVLADDYVVEFGKFSNDVKKRYNSFKIKYYDYIGVPGFVNAHTHLVFSCLSLKRRFYSFLDFVKSLNNFINNWSYDDYKKSYLKGIELLKNSNSTLAIDFVPHKVYSTINILTKKGILLFPEFIVSQKQYVEDTLRMVKNYDFLALHSLYSVHKDFIYGVVKDKSLVAQLALHFAEFKDESIFLRNGKGLVCDLFKLHSVDVSNFFIPKRTPTEYLLTLPIINKKLLLIHCNYLSESEIESLIKFNCIFVKCPRSSINLNSDPGNIEILIKNNSRVAIGTDSLASSPSLDILDEAKFIKKHFKIDNIYLWKLISGYYLNGFFHDYSFGYVLTGKKLLLNIYDMKIYSFKDFLECLFSTNIKPRYKIVT